MKFYCSFLWILFWNGYSYNPGNAKNLGVFGLGRSAGVGLYANDKLKPVGGYMSVGVGVPIPFTGYRSF